MVLWLGGPYDVWGWCRSWWGSCWASFIPSFSSFCLDWTGRYWVVPFVTTMVSIVIIVHIIPQRVNFTLLLWKNRSWKNRITVLLLFITYEKEGLLIGLRVIVSGPKAWGRPTWRGFITRRRKRNNSEQGTLPVLTPLSTQYVIKIIPKTTFRIFYLFFF